MRDNPQQQEDDLPIWLALKYMFKRLHVATTPCRPSVVRLRDQDDPHDDAHPERENDGKRKNIYEHETFVSGESLAGQDYESKLSPSTSCNQEQSNDFDFQTDSYATDDDELPTEKVSRELVDEMSQTTDEAKLHKVVDEMLRQRCTLRDEHQYHIDQMQIFLKNDIVWESRKEVLVSLHPVICLSIERQDDRVKELTKTQVLVYVAYGLIMERQQNQVDVAKMIADEIQQERKNLQSEISSQINAAISNHIPS
nr:hypothetical protein [Tanacetum cinerariifolium]